jgi:hypothetical protein
MYRNTTCNHVDFITITSILTVYFRFKHYSYHTILVQRYEISDTLSRLGLRC